MSELHPTPKEMQELRQKIALLSELVSATPGCTCDTCKAIRRAILVELRQVS